MPKKRTSLPKMSCDGHQEPEFRYTRKRDGVSFYAYFCEGCGQEKVIPDNVDFDSSPPIFWSDRNGGCGCTKRRELTEYSDPCKKCSAPIYLTPGGAMHQKYARAEGNYKQWKEY